ncbi:MAG: hypothetical protein KL785_06060, partial [Brevundimonas sp.]|nr:hypothetical protein [Brevundimonas sp.]
MALAQTVRHDVIAAGRPVRDERLWVLTLSLGALTMVVSLAATGSVFGLAITSVSLLGAGIAPAMACRLLGWRPSLPALMATVVMGFGVAAGWLALGLSAIINEAAPGMAAGFLAA